MRPFEIRLLRLPHASANSQSHTRRRVTRSHRHGIAFHCDARMPGYWMLEECIREGAILFTLGEGCDALVALRMEQLLPRMRFVRPWCRMRALLARLVWGNLPEGTVSYTLGASWGRRRE